MMLPMKTGVYFARTVATDHLRMMGDILDAHDEAATAATAATAAAAPLEDLSISDLWAFFEGANALNADPAIQLIQRELARRLDGRKTEELRVILGAAAHDHDASAVTERADAVAEAAFLPYGAAGSGNGQQVAAAASAASNAAAPPLQQQPSLSGIDENDWRILALGEVSGETLIELKGVGREWAALARRVLFKRLCHRRDEQRPDEQYVANELGDVTDLNVTALADAGRACDLALAGQLLPNLERLRGDGFVVNIAKVRAADLPEDVLSPQSRPFGGEALRGCITGDGEPPLDLLLAAIACAGSGVVRGTPVQQLRENDAIGDLNLSERGLGVNEARLLALLLPRASSILTLECVHPKQSRGRSAPPFICLR